MMDFRSRTRGRWGEILRHFGVDPRLLNGKGQPCPFCGGKDRFAFKDNGDNGMWVCRSCGSGSASDLLMGLKQWDFRTMAREVETIVGSIEPIVLKAAETDSLKKARLRRLWEESRRIERGDPAALWLNRRVGNILFPSCLRQVDELFYAENKTIHPGMIARVDGPDGTPVTIHRTYLTEKGYKAKVEKPRMLMNGVYPPGSAVRLFNPAAGRLAVAEGIETSLAVFKTFALPVWSLLNTSNMKAFTPPDVVTELFIFADHDEKYAGQLAAYTLAKRSVEKMKVHVLVPDHPGEDWNDVWHRHTKRSDRRDDQVAPDKDYGAGERADPTA